MKVKVVSAPDLARATCRTIVMRADDVDEDKVKAMEFFLPKGQVGTAGASTPGLSIDRAFLFCAAHTTLFSMTFFLAKMLRESLVYSF
eukprot:1159708-Pelagomonas_calceolata.AAC.2